MKLFLMVTLLLTVVTSMFSDSFFIKYGYYNSTNISNVLYIYDSTPENANEMKSSMAYFWELFTYYPLADKITLLYYIPMNVGNIYYIFNKTDISNMFYSNMKQRNKQIQKLK